MRILHCSDIHVPMHKGDLGLVDYLGKRFVGATNYWLRRHHLYRDANLRLEALAELAKQNQVDLIVLSGDLTQLGTDAEYQRARVAIDALRSAAPFFVMVPGNHDIYLRDVMRDNRWAHYFGDIAPTTWPTAIEFGDHLRCVLISSAVPQPQVWKAAGFISGNDIQALEAMLNMQRDDRFTFVITHHAPLRANGKPDHPAHGLQGGDDLLRACSQMKWGALLHGHIHGQFALMPPQTSVPIFCAGSSTSAHHGSFWMYTLDADQLNASPGNWDGTRYVIDGAKMLTIKRQLP